MVEPQQAGQETRQVNLHLKVTTEARPRFMVEPQTMGVLVVAVQVALVETEMEVPLPVQTVALEPLHPLQELLLLGLAVEVVLDRLPAAQGKTVVEMVERILAVLPRPLEPLTRAVEAAVGTKTLDMDGRVVLVDRVL